MSTVLMVDLNKNPEVAALVADKQPGDKIYGCFTIKDKDDQTLNMRIKSMAGSCEEMKESGSDDEDDEEDEVDDGQSPEGAEAETPTPPEPASRKLARQMESNGPTSGY